VVAHVLEHLDKVRYLYNGPLTATSMGVLVCNDLHLKPAASDYNIDAMTIPAGVDTVFIAGDLTHRNGTEDITLARRFIDRFDVDVLYVPGNHDPDPMPERVVDGFKHATSGHNVVCVSESSTVIGWGCEHRSLDTVLDQAAFPHLIRGLLHAENDGIERINLLMTSKPHS